ncbi:MAG: hypothetical protein ABSC05_29520 [Candidatus Solibacter sp.]
MEQMTVGGACGSKIKDGNVFAFAQPASVYNAVKSAKSERFSKHLRGRIISHVIGRGDRY